MTDMMILDLSADDGLLVPFRGFSEPTTGASLPRKESSLSSSKPDPLCASNSSSNSNSNDNSSRGFGRFLFPRRIPPEPPKNDKVPLKVTTFAFPNARVDVADNFFDPNDDNIKAPQLGDDDFQEEDEEGSPCTGATSRNEKRLRSNPATPITPNSPDPTRTTKKSLRNLDEWDPSENPWYEEKTPARTWRLEGIGNEPAKPANEKDPKGLTGLWRNLLGQHTTTDRRRREEDDLRTMKVATEATKDDKTLLEQVGKAALVVLVPELYADDEDGEGNLGMYRAIASNADDDDEDNDDASRSKLIQTRSQSQDLSSLKTELQQLRLKVLRLEKALKTSELEANSWKIRCKEVETELRRYKGQCDEDSSLEGENVTTNNRDVSGGEQDEEADDGIEEWGDFSSVTEGALIDITSGGVESDLSANRTIDDNDLLGDTNVGDDAHLPQSNRQQLIEEGEPDLMDLTDNTLVFDPLAK